VTLDAPTRTALLTSLALLCFSANSILCRLALAPQLIDPVSFTSVRILSAAMMLAALHWLRRRKLPRLSYANHWSIAAVFAYMLFFSFSYVRLSAGTGALILLGGVQLTMFSVALREGERFSSFAWAGLAAAFLGLIFLVLPGVTAPDPLGALLMTLSGAAWGLFSVLALSAGDPVEVNASNLLLCIPPALLVSLVSFGELHGTATGYLLATASGAGATGFGYIVWYLALRGLRPGLAATVQLSMPVIVALAGVVLLTEPLTGRLIIASAAVIGGIAIVLWQRSRDRA
jgi:drug/metabolite transporter (DMT)-like permease